MKRLLVACEYSGRVRDAFARRGWDAWSCDLLPTESPGQHYQTDVLDVLTCKQWDLLIAHPPCTYLSNSGVRWLYKGGRGQDRNGERWQRMNEAAAFFAGLLHCGVPRVCVENPIPHKYGITLKPTQIIQPWQHGHGETKATCLWLRGLPPLIPSNIVSGRTPRVHHASPGPDRWKERSRTMPGIAKAMADQWGDL